MGNVRKYRSLSLPVELLELVEKTIEEHPEFGYSSLTEFVKDAIRSKLFEFVKKKEVQVDAV
jgi:metal-responsive CopG/Arc/MetJ family transcriptional regulator